MNINCIYPQKKINSPYMDAISEYEKRLQRYCKWKRIANGKSERFPAPIYITSGEACKSVLSSEDFAAFIERQGLEGRHELSFVLTDSASNTDDSFSICAAPLNFDMLLVLFTEQLYRAFRIIHNHSYHK